MPLSDEQVAQYRSRFRARRDRYGHFRPTTVPARDFDPVAVAFHARAAKAMRDVLYAGAEKNPQRL